MWPMLIATKMRRPAIRDQVIPRERLLDRLRAGSGLTLTLVICPAGFGKTTLSPRGTMRMIIAHTRWSRLLASTSSSTTTIYFEA